MKFNEKSPTHLISEDGNYKVVKYASWMAYYKAIDSVYNHYYNHYSCEVMIKFGGVKSVSYSTKEEAIQACERHHNKFRNPRKEDKIIKGGD